MGRDFQVIEKHHVVLRICHWVNIPLLCLMVWSRLLIYWANPVYLEIPDELGPFKIHHRLAERMGWHFFIMWIFFINGIIYLSMELPFGSSFPLNMESKVKKVSKESGRFSFLIAGHRITGPKEDMIGTRDFDINLISL